MSKIYKGSLLTTTVMAGLAVVSPAYAQDVPAAPPVEPSAQSPAQEIADQPAGVLTDPEKGEAIVVTGSRIRRTDLTSSSPVAVATAAEITASGETANVESFLNELPQFVPSTTGASNNPGNGLATIDLRGGGASRTLVLVDGKRFIPSTLGGVVDINNIPTPLVERIEVVTGGASAVYGSDALTGVVNFVLKRNFSGLELNGQYRITERGDSAIFTTSALVGGNFDDGRGNAVLMLGYTDRKATFADQRKYSRQVLIDSVPNGAGTAGGCTPGTLNSFDFGTRAPGGAGVPRTPCFVQGGSTLVPSGNYFDLGVILDDNGNPRPFIDPQDRFNFAPFNYLQLPQERFTGTALARYEINEHFEPFGRLSFSYNKVPTELAPTPVADAFDINLSNPFLTPAFAAALAPLDLDPDFGPVGDGIVNTFFGRRMLETGSRQNPLETYSFQSQIGMRGEIVGGWNYEGFYQYGRTALNERLLGDVSRERLQQSLLVGGTAAAPVCLDPSNGCVPANIFLANGISPEAAAFVGLSAQAQTVVKEEVAGLVVNGELPIGLIGGKKPGIAVGLEYRDVDGSFEPDEALQFNVLGFNTATPTRGGFNVKEAFIEASIPLITDTFIHDLTFNGAYRYSDYSTVGGIKTYSAGVEFAPIRDIRFRAQYQRAIRAPNIGELFSGQGNNFPNAIDPCSSSQPLAQQTAAIRAACINSGVQAANVFVFSQPGGSQVEELIGGNPNLTEETSDTYTAGVVLTPRFLPGFNATIDWYSIKIADAISTFGGGAANILSTCLTTLGGDPGSPFCTAIQRRPNGPINQIVSTNANIAAIELEGVDFAIDYRRAFPWNVLGEGTAVAVIIRGTRTLKQQSQADPLADLVDCVGLYGNRCGNPTPKWIVNNTLSLTGKTVGFTLQHRYLSKTFDNRQQRFENPFSGTGADFTAINRPSSKIKDYHIFDGSVQFDINEHYRMSLGVDNMFDRDPPVVGDNADEQNNIYPSRFDAFGRKFWMSAQVKF